MQTVDDWLAHLRSLGRKPKTLEHYRLVITRAIRENGWQEASELTFQAVTRWIASKNYAPASHNSTVSVLRNFLDYAGKIGDLTDAAVEAIPRAKDVSSGSRAASTEEARALIAQAFMRTSSDRRAKGDRAVYWLCLFAAACRLGEPARWRRRHLVLDHSVPHIAWDNETHKAGRRVMVAIAPELAEVLGRHLAAEDARREKAGLPPAGADAKIFDTVPTKNIWAKDRANAGIVDRDRYGVPITSHSARKWFSTTATSVGIPRNGGFPDAALWPARASLLPADARGTGRRAGQSATALAVAHPEGGR